jgi:hypothetical protein
MGARLNRLGLPDTDGVGGFLKRNWLRLTAVVSSMAGLVLIIAFVGSDPQATEQTNRPDKLTRADTVEFQETQKRKADFDKIQNGWKRFWEAKA